MVEHGSYPRWSLAPTDLVNLTPLKARDIIIKCFYEAQKETFARVSKQFGKAQDEAEVETTVRAAVRMAFKEGNLDFDNPSKASLLVVVQILARKASTWGTPEDVIAHHQGQIEKVLNRL